MIKNLKYLFIQILTIFIFVLLLPPLLIREKIVIDKSGAEASFNLSQNQYFTENINHHFPNINSISLRLKNPLIKNNAQITVEINDTNGKLIKDFTFFGANIGDPSWIKLKFTPLNISDFQIKIYSEGDSKDLYLYVDSNNQLDLITTSYLPGFKNRFLENIKFQITQIQNRNQILNLFYLLILFILNIYLVANSRSKSLKKQ